MKLIKTEEGNTYQALVCKNCLDKSRIEVITLEKGDIDDYYKCLYCEKNEFKNDLIISNVLVKNITNYYLVD